MPELEWPSLLKDRIVLSSELATQQIRELALPPAHIRTEMEDCDFGEDECDREYSFGKHVLLIVIFMPYSLFSSNLPLISEYLQLDWMQSPIKQRIKSTWARAMPFYSI